MTVQFKPSIPGQLATDMQPAASAPAAPTMTPASLTPLAVPPSGTMAAPLASASPSEQSPLTEQRLAYFGVQQQRLLARLTAAGGPEAGSRSGSTMTPALRADCIAVLAALADSQQLLR